MPKDRLGGKRAKGKTYLNSINPNKKRDFTIKKDTINASNDIIPKGTPAKGVIVLAGGKRRRKVDSEPRLIRKYGGKKGEWTKERATLIINGKPQEYHYYYHKNYGRVEYKKI